ncbi:MAG: sigma-70 family RNA polymerase sigma factor [Nitrospinota bacterium]|nr:sigma-70 family RNA polymerase sigma factor [Nitrospinota bacterium]
MEKISDIELLKLSKNTNQEYFREFYRRNERKIRGTLSRVAGTTHLDDLTQEVFIKIWKGFAKLREEAYLSTWIYRLTMNVAFDSLRSDGEKDKKNIPLEDEDSVKSDTDIQSDYHGKDMVEKALKTLSPEHKAVVVLHDLDELLIREIGEILKISEGTVKSRLFHARKNLREYFRKEGIEL